MKPNFKSFIVLAGMLVGASAMAQNLASTWPIYMAGCKTSALIKIIGNGNGGKALAFEIEKSACSNIKISANGISKEYKLQGRPGSYQGSYSAPKGMLLEGAVNSVEFCVQSNSSKKSGGYNGSYDCKTTVIDVSRRGNVKGGVVVGGDSQRGGVPAPQPTYRAPSAPSAGSAW